jgi:hypothetical protein
VETFLVLKAELRLLHGESERVFQPEIAWLVTAPALLPDGPPQ